MAVEMNMDLQLRPEVQKFVEDRVKAGQFSSTTEVVRGRNCSSDA